MKNLPNSSQYFKYSVFAVSLLMVLTLTGKAIVSHANLLARGPVAVVADTDGSDSNDNSNDPGGCGDCSDQESHENPPSEGNNDENNCPPGTITEQYVKKVAKNGKVHYGTRCVTPTPTPTPVVTPTPTPTPVVTPTPTPTPVVTPTPTTVVTPTPTPPFTCVEGKHVEVKNSQLVCIENTNTNTNTNENNINNEFNPTINIDNSSQVLGAEAPQVVSQAPSEAKSLPKTGLPLAAWALSGLLPAGLRLRKVNKSSTNESANFIWEERQLIK